MTHAATRLHEYHSAPIPSTSAPASMAATVYRHREQSPDLVLFQRPRADDRWLDVTASDFADEVLAVAKGLIASGIQVGDRVAIHSATRYEWVLLDYAIWAVGACTVAVYDSSAADQVRWILRDSGAALLITETERHRALAIEASTDAPDLREILTIDADAVGELVRRGTDLDDAAVRQRLRQIGPHSPATLIYTSGTTGRPKGAVLTHGNLAAEVHAVVSVADGLLGPGRKTVLFLPLAHVFARVISVGAVEAGATVVHSSDWSTLPQQFATHRPDFVLAVPRVFEKVFTTAEQTARDAGRGHVFDRAVSTAIAWSRARDTGRAGLQLRLEHKLFDRLVYARIRSALGGRCTQAVSGGGPLGARLSEFFRGAGITVYEGYGLTETSAAVTLNTPGSIRVGSVGRPIPGQSVRVAADGELLLRGPVVFGGRWNNPQATAEAFEDGWFRSGDLGEIDADGFVTVTGRKKEIIVTAAGKNVSPAQLEDVLRADPLVNQAMVVGDGRPFIGALITLDAAALPGWKQRHGVAADTPLTQLTAHPTLLAEIEAVVARANATVSNAERIKRIRVLDADWTQESGELTPKLSLKRAVVAAKFAAEIEALYR